MPANIEEILNSKAPFKLEGERRRRRVRDNHLLTLIPGQVHGAAFTLDKLGALVLKNHGGHFAAFANNNNEELGDNSHGYGFYTPFLTQENRDQALPDAPYWLLHPQVRKLEKLHILRFAKVRRISQ